MDIKVSEKEENVNLTYINNEFTPRMQQTKLDTAGITTTSNICARVTPLDKKCFEHENDDGASCIEKKFTDDERKDSGCSSMVGGQTISESVKDGNSKLYKSGRKGNCNRKNKRKRRRGKQKTNSKPFKKENWKFQMPQRYRSNSNPTNLANMTNVLRKQIQRQRSIVPYNTNKFLMEEHLAEVPNALLTPNGRTRDSSFSVDSEDNYFFSLPEDEEDFLTKEFSNVYERARVERLENMNKQQLIEECLQMEDRCSQIDSKQHEKYCAEFMSKIKFLEEKIQRLNRENNELRRLLEHSNDLDDTTKLSHKSNKSGNRMCSSEDSESDSSSSGSSSSGSCSSSCSTSSISDFSPPSSPSSPKTHSKELKNGSQNMDTDEQIDNKHQENTVQSEEISVVPNQIQQDLQMQTQLSTQNSADQNQLSLNVNGDNSQSVYNGTDLHHNDNNEKN
ncbi:protein HEXIM1 [Condylostylus longicornis]|uniref:protein HEXIM1 n=1 Tax=Condylostylus longicornis TaxID=2530218 RepID=UPI00244E377B|nr:protein HEXIM1 [Condylostylus longicornis]